MRLEVKNLSFSYTRDKVIFHDVDFTLGDGDVLSVLGANGAGKSTMLNCIAGLLAPKTGDILFDGQSMFSMSRKEISRRLGYVPQIHDSSFAFTVLEYVVMGRTPYIRAYETPSQKDYDIARENLAKVGMGGLEYKVFTELSGGQQQLSTIARALTQESPVILLDEPTNHLDFGNQFRTVGTIRQLSELGYVVVTTTHNPDHVFELGGQVAILDADGEIRIGTVEESLTEERLSELYGMDIGIAHGTEAGHGLCYVKRTGRPAGPLP